MSKKIKIFYDEKANKQDDYGNMDELENELEEENHVNETEPYFENFITSRHKYTKNSEFITFGWNGIDFLERWELQRKIDYVHASALATSMKRDYKNNKEFISYDPIHLAIRADNKYYVLDGQHRLEAYKYFYSSNKYPIQQIPAILWKTESDHDFIELFNKINSRLSIDKVKLVQVKLFEIFELLEKKYTNGIWGLNRPRINKEIFAEKLRNTDFIHKLTTEQIVSKLISINIQIRKIPRDLRIKPNCSSNIHNLAEQLDFFLGLDKSMEWIEQIK
jgi:hypothetical protein